MKFLLLLLLPLLVASKVSYEGHQVWRLEGIKSGVHVRLVHELIERELLDVMSEGHDWVEVRVSPEQAARLAHRNLNHRVVVDNLQRLIDQEEQELAKRSTRATKIVFDQYNTYDEIAAYQADLAAANSMVTTESIGTTLEGRNIWVSKISTGAGKPAVWLDFGIHSREWITSATAVWGLDFLTTNYGSDAIVTQLLDTYDLYIVPVTNPDGYSFTWTDDRMWRKNRNPNDGGCFGVDLNRNFDDGHFGGDGSSDLLCSETYHGPTGFSELETQAVRDYTSAISNLKSFYTIHSYSQMWMWAYGWTTDLSPDDAELSRVGNAGADALTAVYGTPYERGSINNVIYAASGTSIDWAYTVLGVTYTYTLELRDTGVFGFQLPAGQILETADETWAGLIAAILAM